MSQAARVCHANLRDKWQDTPHLEFTDEWKTESRPTSAPGWFIWGSAIATGEDGATLELEYICVTAHRDLRTFDFHRIAPYRSQD